MNHAITFSIDIPIDDNEVLFITFLISKLKENTTSQMMHMRRKFLFIIICVSVQEISDQNNFQMTTMAWCQSPPISERIIKTFRPQTVVVNNLVAG